MTTFAVALVVAAAALHASWNVLVKRSADKLVFIWLTGLVGCVLLLPVAAWLSPLPDWNGAVWGRIALAAALRAGYFVLLSTAYGRGDLSTVYPIARGVGPMMVVAAAVAVLGERVTLGAAWGVALVAVGAYVVHLPALTVRALAGAVAALRSEAVAYAILTGSVTAAYSIVDKWNIAAGIPPAWYAYLTIPLAALLLTPLVIGRRAHAAELRRHRGSIAAVALMMSASYLLVLHAFQLAPVSYVAPARELGIVFGVLLGVVALGEGGAPQRVAGAVLIVAGVVLIVTSPPSGPPQ